MLRRACLILALLFAMPGATAAGHHQRARRHGAPRPMEGHLLLNGPFYAYRPLDADRYAPVMFLAKEPWDMPLRTDITGERVYDYPRAFAAGVMLYVRAGVPVMASPLVVNAWVLCRVVGGARSGRMGWIRQVDLHRAPLE